MRGRIPVMAIIIVVVAVSDAFTSKRFHSWTPRRKSSRTRNYSSGRGLRGLLSHFRQVCSIFITINLWLRTDAPSASVLTCSFVVATTKIDCRHRHRHRRCRDRCCCFNRTARACNNKQTRTAVILFHCPFELTCTGHWLWHTPQRSLRSHFHIQSLCRRFCCC